MTRMPALALSVLLLAACSPDRDPSDGTASSNALWGQNVKLDATGHPRAEVSAKGDFIVDGKAVPVNDQQRALLVAYHRELGGIADAGIATGRKAPNWPARRSARPCVASSVAIRTRSTNRWKPKPRRSKRKP